MFAIVFIAATLAGCGSRTMSTAGADAVPLTPFAAHLSKDTTNAPRHVVVIVQENRSFDNLFQKLPGADTQSYGLNRQGAHIPLQQISLSSPWGPQHTHGDFNTEFDNGKLDGFEQEKCERQCGRDGAYSYVDPADVAQYYAMAEQYAIADHNLQPNEGPSWPAHLYLIAAQSGQPGSKWYVSENPSGGAGQGGYDGKGGKQHNEDCLANPNVRIDQIDMTTAFPGTEGNPIFPCVNPPTILDELRDNGYTWKYYVPNLGTIWTAPCDVSAVRCPENKGVVVPETTVLSDIANRKLATVSWVIPSGPNSDHPGPKGNGGGPAWVSSVVDAIGQSPYWADTTIFVVWDDWGGWYDHYLSGNGHPAANPTDPYEYGLRVPLIAIGAYVRPHLISHTPRDFTSILHFLEDNYGLPSLGKLDAQTDDLAELFDFSQTPNQFTPFDQGPMTIQQRLMLPPDPSAVDDD
jgi:phospholipase C